MTKEEAELSDSADGYYYGIHEVFYEDGKPSMYTQDPISVQGENIEELKQTLKWMQECLELPVLDQDLDFPSEEN